MQHTTLSTNLIFNKNVHCVMKISVIMASALVLLVLPGYAFAAPSIVTSLTASVEDGAGGFEELEGPKGVTAVTVGSSTYALVAAYGDDGVQIINITDPNNPTPVASIGDGEDGFEELKGARYVTTVTIDSSTYALVSASADHGVQIINITTPSSPSPVAHVSNAAGLALRDPRGIATLTTGSSTYALVATHEGFVQIINITTPSSPAPVASILDGSGGFEALSRARGITTVTLDSSTYALVASYDDGVQIINVTNPSEPAPVAAVLNSQSNRLDGATGITTVTVGSSTYALVAAQNDDAVQIINITDPSSPESVAFAQDGSAGFDRLDYPESIATVTFGSSTYAVVASFLDGIQIINITDPSNPSPAASVGSFDTRFGNFALPEAITAVTIDSKTYVLVASYSSNSVPIIGVDLTFGPVLTSATFDEGTGILETVFSDTVDVTPSHLIDLSKMTVGDFGQSVSLTGAALMTETDSAVLSIELTEDQGRSVATMASPRLDISGSAVTDTSGNPIDSTSDNIIAITDNVAPEVVSVTLNEETGILEITFSDRVDVTPAFMVYPGGMTVSDSGQSVSLAGATLRTEADSAVISIELTEGQRQSVAALASPMLGIDHYSIMDTEGNPIESSSGNAVAINNASEILTVTSIERSDPAVETTSAQTLVFGVTFSEDVTGVDAGDFALSSGGTGTGSVTNLAGSGSQYLVSVSATRDGTYNLDVTQDSGIADAADNPLSSTTPTGADHTYTVNTIPADTTAPTVASIVRSDPAEATTSERTLVFGVTFSEDVTGVDAGDFALSPDSTGGGSSSGRFAQTSEPAISITDHNTIQDAITVDQSDTATSVSVAVDISHTYIGDLVVELTAPDGTAQTLHSRAGGSANDIDQTYTPDFDGTGIAGDWILRVSDRAGGDTGTLDSWTLTIDHGGADSPVTALTGSGSQYLVNVSAAQDGTYNLDITQDSGIADAADNPLSSTTPTGADHTYTVNTIPADTTAPTVASIVRSDPAEATTSERTLVFGVTFSEDVTGVDLSDFALSSGGTGTGSVTNLAGSGSQYLVSVSATRDGTYNLDVTQDSGIADAADNPLSSTTPTGADHTYTVNTIPADTTAPTVASIVRSDPAEATTSEQTLVFGVTFSEDVTGVDAGDFALSSGGTGTGSVTSLAGSGSQYLVNVSAARDGTYNLDVTQDSGIADAADNPLSSTTPTGADHTYTVNTIPADTTAPTVASIVRSDPAEATTSERTLVFGVTFSEDVTGVDLSDFALSSGGTGTGSVTSLTGSGSQYLVNVSAARDGTYNLDVTQDSGIADAADNPLSSTTPTGADHTYTVNTIPADTTAPTVASIVRSDPAEATTSERTLVFGVTFSEDVTGVDLSDFALSSGGTGTGSVTSLTGSGSQYLVNVSAARDGTYNLDIVPNNDIADMASNPLGGTGPTGEDQPYTVRTSAIQNATTNTPPSINAGPDQTVQEGSTVTLSGTASGQDGGQLTYSWSHDSALDISLANADSLSPAFTAPQVSANTTVTFTLTADDGTDTHSDTVTVTILDVPVVGTPNRGSDQNTTAVLNPDGPLGPRDIGRITLTSAQPGTIQASWEAPSETPVDYRISWAKAGEPYLTWTDLSGNAFLTGPSRTIADLEEGETYKVMVRARYGGSSGDWSGEITITVARSANNPPTADAGTAQAVQEGDTVTLNGTASDQDDDQLTYSWSHDSALDISLANADSLSPAFTAPQVSANTTVTFTLTADDGTDTHSDTVTVTILDVPVVGTPNRGSDQNTTAVLNPDGPLGPRDIGRITLTSAQPGTIQASWEAPSETPADYRISWAKAGEPYLTWTDLSGNAFPTDPSRTIADLEEGETYKVMVRARYGGSSGDWSGEITITVARTG